MSVEPDSPKELYIFKLTGDVANYIGELHEDIEDKMIVKVGLSKAHKLASNDSTPTFPQALISGKPCVQPP